MGVGGGGVGVFLEERIKKKKKKSREFSFRTHVDWPLPPLGSPIEQNPNTGGVGVLSV